MSCLPTVLSLDAPVSLCLFFACFAPKATRSADRCSCLSCSVVPIFRASLFVPVTIRGYPFYIKPHAWPLVVVYYGCCKRKIFSSLCAISRDCKGNHDSELRTRTTIRLAVHDIRPRSYSFCPQIEVKLYPSDRKFLSLREKMHPRRNYELCNIGLDASAILPDAINVTKVKVTRELACEMITSQTAKVHPLYKRGHPSPQVSNPQPHIGFSKGTQVGIKVHNCSYHSYKFYFCNSQK